jgi:UDP-N-acetylglucosamine--N-acetylmuramyl-(pentapeptide) pyrophosphoryl-undecaprenol N-acetylglucosamine transferase
MSRVLLACGGTGGHLAPGIALAQRLTDEGHECLLVVSSKAVDARMTADYPRLKFVAGRGRGFGPGWINRLLFLPALCASIGSSLRLLRGFRPDVLVCFGGFMSVGPALACWLRGIPVIVHESNRRPGKAVRLIARFARSLHLPTGVRLEGVPLDRQHDSGFPVRKEIRPSAKEVARKTLGFPSSGKLLLVAGGSQGSRALTKWVEAQLEEISVRGLHVLCLTGPGGRGGEVRAGDSVVRFLPFCNQMGVAYSAADLAMTRAGAGTLAELAACRTPAILVPFPFAADDHQTANARHFAQTGAALLVPEGELFEATANIYDRLLNNAALAEMRDALALADAANRWEELFQETVQLARPPRASAG